MAAFPFSYYKVLRDEYIAEVSESIPKPEEDDDTEVIDFNADVLKGEAV